MNKVKNTIFGLGVTALSLLLPTSAAAAKTATKNSTPTKKTVLINANDRVYSEKSGYQFKGWISYFIDDKGDLARFFSEYQVDASQYKKDISTINMALSRANQKRPYDDIGSEFEASQFIIRAIVFNSIRNKIAAGKPVANGALYVAKFKKMLARDGLVMDKSGKLVGDAKYANQTPKSYAYLLKNYKDQEDKKYQEYLGKKPAGLNSGNKPAPVKKPKTPTRKPVNPTKIKEPVAETFTEYKERQANDFKKFVAKNKKSFQEYTRATR